MKFNLEYLEEKINNIRNQSTNIDTNIVKYSNKKQIELILYGFFFVLNYYYNIRKNEYENQISYFSENYLLGSDWYLGPEYTYEHFYNEQDDDTKLKMFLFLNIMSKFYLVN
tara:strand:- start:111 stop:446 length:336 start_codon:yes stop_codon:yes gene_type:complete